MGKPLIFNELENVKSDISDNTSQLSQNTNKSIVNPEYYGAIADGISHTIGDTLPSVTLAEVQALDATATLDDEVDWYAIQKAISVLESNSGGTVSLEAKTYIISKPIVLSGFAISDGWDEGGTILKGASSRGTIIKSNFTGSAIKRLQSMFNNIETLTVLGQGKADVGSVGIEVIGTGGNNLFRDVYVDSFEKGITTFDVTLFSCENVAIRNCGKGFVGQYQSDIFTFTGCRFEYCDNNIYIGERTTGHETGSLEENCWKFIGCRISSSEEESIIINDYGVSSVNFDSCYFEDNVKEGLFGNSLAENPNPFAISFKNCYWTASSRLISGYTVYGNTTLKIEDCKIDATVGYEYDPFISAKNGTAKVEICNIKKINVNALLNYVDRTFDYNSTEGQDFKLNRKVFHENALDLETTMENPFDMTITGGTGKGFMSIKKASSSTHATLAEMFLKDISGVLRLGFSTAYIQVTSVSALPTASSTYRGMLARVEGGTGVADATYICKKNSSDIYEWSQIN